MTRRAIILAAVLATCAGSCDARGLSFMASPHVRDWQASKAGEPMRERFYWIGRQRLSSGTQLGFALTVAKTENGKPRFFHVKTSWGE